MDQAARLRDARQNAEAEAVYRDIVSRQPDYHPAWSELGVLAFWAGDLPAARAYAEKAVSIEAEVALYWRNVCELRRLAGAVDEAIAAGRRATQLAPNDPDAHHNLSLALADAGRLEEAIAGARRALELNPLHSAGWNNLGHWLLKENRLFEAGQAVERATGVDPGNAEAHYNRALVAYRLGDRGEARKWFERAIALKPGLASNGHKGLQQLWVAEAVAPPVTDEDVTPGLKLSSEGMFEAAIAYHEAKGHDRSNHLAALANLAQCYADVGRPADAVVAAERALAMDPSCHSARLVLATSQIELGQWKEGWENYEARFVGALEVQTGRYHFPKIPLAKWSGETGTETSSILVVVEQGYGDMIQFCRYLHRLRERFARIGLLTSPPLMRLMEWTFGDHIEILVTFPGDYSAWDRYVMMMSLPRAFGTRVDTVPAETPYLRTPLPARQYWRRRLERAGANGPRIGVCWTGRREHRFNSVRSIPLDRLERLLSVADVTWVSLQMRDKREPGPRIPADAKWIDWTQELSDFGVTAALVANLDLIIGIDSVNVHLAGALGVPVWLLNRRNSEWRWMAPRVDSPWYPTLRIFRQKSMGDWDGVVDEVGRQVRRFADDWPRSRPSGPSCVFA